MKTTALNSFGQDASVNNHANSNTTTIISSDLAAPGYTYSPDYMDDRNLKSLSYDSSDTIAIEVNKSISDNEPLLLDSTRIYKPPVLDKQSRITDTFATNAPSCDELNLDEFEAGKVSVVWINLVKQGLGDWIKIPVIIAKGLANSGKNYNVFGLTAAMHGNELNGIPVIHAVLSTLDLATLYGTVVAIPCVNVVGFNALLREYMDGKDLNRQFPGASSGMASQVFAYAFLTKIAASFTHLVDLHTASCGRVNSFYVRADMNGPDTKAMAELMHPEIILHNSGQEGTFRGELTNRKIKAITVEIGNPQRFHPQYINWTVQGILRILSHYEMIPEVSQYQSTTILLNQRVSNVPPHTILCSKGFWIYTTVGGILEVYPPIGCVIRKGNMIACVKDIFGNILETVYCPENGVNIGCAENPVAFSGDRVLHLGVLMKPGEVLSKAGKENY
ncbi:hypothetical protein HK100_010676 [Physocladia obscura]|uniref:Succinylglutamate desuccinylase/Aspartoacylase catalytic domain-containing protein n=1 Tax=Physocladia obscura TaxID=109957 RepID=A0AAD5T860_9FUNG|nr:hypothetical protein HK100_010676 [Physocladia obscura]